MSNRAFATTTCLVIVVLVAVPIVWLLLQI